MFIILFVIFIALALWLGLGTKKEIVLSSPFEGRVTLDGKPVANARVIQKLEPTKFDHITQETKTDADGKFRLPLAVTSSRFTATDLDMSYSATKQSISIEIGDKTYLAWFYSKTDSELGSEIKAKDIKLENVDVLKLECSLNSPEEYKGTYLGVCSIADNL